MTALYICLGVAGGMLLLALLYVASTRGRTGHLGLESLRKYRYAHRGLHSAGVPENSLAAFREAVKLGLGSELDVHLMADGDLAVIHDAKLKRTTGRDGTIEQLTAADLKNYPLEGTSETIPTFRQMLEVYGGKAPLIIELKVVGGNHAALCKEVLRQLQDYRGAYCIESFDPRAIRWLRKNAPEVIRGQLTENFLKGKPSFSWLISWAMTTQVLNFLTRPDFVAYKFEDRKCVSNTLARKLWGVQGASWTIRTKENLEIAEQEGWIPIFENFIP